MKIEYAMQCLRQGQAIWRQLAPEKGYLKGKVDQEGNIGPIYGSFYLTIYDVLAEDWTNEEYPEEEDED